ncbi:hypothetical protein CRI94_12305 [Longibacter salinarum]|uniref:Phage shock protein B n=1 Tax=Longibacter salinarum TaxID=1850348 RepID=A0A2A8CW06_9BACT|nr:hypothetical protein [Longibacter salinarum]PEN12790.1 hypothetical protein CRI94_12305 [Longibacter salinarum]
MLSPGTLSILLLFGLPIVAVISWVYVKQLEITSQSGDDDRMRDLEQTISSLAKMLDDVKQERDSLRRRIQNLETIVTSESWDDLKARRVDQDTTGDLANSNASSTEKRTASSDTEVPDSAGGELGTDSDRAARLADRLRGSS